MILEEHEAIVEEEKSNPHRAIKKRKSDAAGLRTIFDEHEEQIAKLDDNIEVYAKVE